MLQKHLSYFYASLYVYLEPGAFQYAETSESEPNLNITAKNFTIIFQFNKLENISLE